MKKLKKPDLFDLTVNEVFKYTLAFRKYVSLLWGNFLHCLSSVGKCVQHSVSQRGLLGVFKGMDSKGDSKNGLQERLQEGRNILLEGLRHDCVSVGLNTESAATSSWARANNVTVIPPWHNAKYTIRAPSL